MTNNSEIPTVQREIKNMVLCAALKSAIREEIRKELSFVNEKAQEAIATNICDRIYTLLIEGKYEADDVDETERLFREATKGMGW